jgi:hypothetical protein
MKADMIGGMTRLTIAVPDELADKIKAAAGGNVSAWIADLARDALLRQEAAAVARFEAEQADRTWDLDRWAA